MSSIDVSVIIDADPTAVWADVQDISSHVTWMADAESITFTSASTSGLGTTFDCATKVGPLRLTDKMEITEWDPERAMGVRHVGLVTGTGRFTLQPVGEGRTEFRWREDLRFPLWLGGPIGERVGAVVLKAIWKRNLTALKRRIEGTASR